MRRTAPTLDAFDPELRDAAREAARRAGLSVDEWLAEAISEGSARAGVRQQSRRSAAGSRRARQDAFQATAFQKPDLGEARRPDRGWQPEAPRAPRVRPPRPSVEAAAPVPPVPDPAADARLMEAVAAIGRRLDAIDRRIVETREATDDVVAKAVQGFETRLAETRSA